MARMIAGVMRWALGAIAVVGALAVQAEAPAPVTLGQHIFPESISSGPDGSLFVGSLKGGVLRVSPQGKVSQWLAPGAYQTRSIFGVLADVRGRTLWLCSTDMSSYGIATPGTQGGKLAQGAGSRDRQGQGELPAARGQGPLQ